MGRQAKLKARNKILKDISDPKNLKEHFKKVCVSFYAGYYPFVKENAKTFERGCFVFDMTVPFKYEIKLIDLKTLQKKDPTECISYYSLVDFKKLLGLDVNQKADLNTAVGQTLNLIENYDRDKEICALFTVDDLPEIKLKRMDLITAIDLDFINPGKSFKRSAFIIQ